MTRAARSRRVIYWEEPWFEDPVTSSFSLPALDLIPTEAGPLVALPLLPDGIDEVTGIEMQRRMLDQLIRDHRLGHPLLWYYTPQMLPLSRHLRGAPVVYDCMDELSAFNGADRALPFLERELLGRADLVFTGGYSLYDAKRQRHPSVHPFPSGVDVAHFRPAREGLSEPQDQAGIPHPRIGFYGVLDERLDLALLADAATRQPDWHFVLVGPVAKLKPHEMPARSNIHYLGPKRYHELPAYLSGWDVAMMPFARKEATRFISPTKTPEYLAGGRPVVSTPITDIVRHYGQLEGVEIVATAEEFIQAAKRCLTLAHNPGQWIPKVDRVLAGMSWDRTWDRMSTLIDTYAVKRADAEPILAAPRITNRLKKRADVLVAGAGFAGAVMAERLAASGRNVVVAERRPHIAGNAYDHPDGAGILVHKYGPHIFHTKCARIVAYLSRFTKWRPYEHRVLARIADQLLPIPINRTTVNRFFGLQLSEDEVAAFLTSKAEQIVPVRTSADVVISHVGKELYEAFFRGYTRKQWGIDPSGLDKSVTARIPTRTNDDDRYFTDSFQAMPLKGYTRLFENLLDHPRITVMIGVDYREVARELEFDHLVYTGPIDAFFDYRYGKLPYRSLRFQHITLNKPQHQPVAVVNYPSESVPYTRITEFKHLTGQTNPKTSLCIEFPEPAGDPYYPIPRAENAALYAKYQAIAD
ncbi:MAG: NAD(P)-binding protein, partial [Acetobacteraceae bacterium]|nr:NAD(P)-binding protein [Acetobacteraceae bacterium]